MLTVLRAGHLDGRQATGVRRSIAPSRGKLPLELRRRLRASEASTRLLYRIDADCSRKAAARAVSTGRGGQESVPSPGRGCTHVCCGRGLHADACGGPGEQLGSTARSKVPKYPIRARNAP